MVCDSVRSLQIKSEVWTSECDANAAVARAPKVAAAGDDDRRQAGDDILVVDHAVAVVQPNLCAPPVHSLGAEHARAAAVVHRDGLGLCARACMAWNPSVATTVGGP